MQGVVYISVLKERAQAPEPEPKEGGLHASTELVNADLLLQHAANLRQTKAHARSVFTQGTVSANLQDTARTPKRLLVSNKVQPIGVYY